MQFRGFAEDGAIVSYTDIRGNLYRDICTGCEVMWTFPLTNETYTLKVHTVEARREGEMVRNAWEGLKPREKAGYVSLPPDTYANASPGLSHDLDSFTPQSQSSISPNFVLLLLYPHNVDHMRYIDKAAIGNTRKSFESLPQPEVQPQRWEHCLEEGNWVTKRLNAPHPCP